MYASVRGSVGVVNNCGVGLNSTISPTSRNAVKSLTRAACCILWVTITMVQESFSTAKVEELLVQLKDSCTIVIVTHNMQQAARVSDFTAFLLVGEMVEFNPTPQLFTTPTDPRTEAYITGRFG